MLTKEKFTTELASLGKNIATMRTRVQGLCLFAIMSARVHENATPAAQLMEKIDGRVINVGAVAAFLTHHAPLRLSKNKATGKKSIAFDSKNKAEFPTELTDEQADALPFWDAFKVVKDKEAENADELLAKFVARLNKLDKDGLLIDAEIDGAPFGQAGMTHVRTLLQLMDASIKDVRNDMKKAAEQGADDEATQEQQPKAA